MTTIEKLIQNIIDNRCILFIGPLMKTFRKEDDSFISHTVWYCDRLIEQLKANKIPFDENAAANPYYLATRLLYGTDTRTKFEEDLVKKAFVWDSEIYRELVVLPFNTIVNFGFDHMMKRAINAKGYAAEFGFYHFRGGEPAHTNVDKNITLLYNLFGSIDDKDSLVHTERDYLEFMRKINSSPKLPIDLLSRIKEDTTINENNKKPKSYIFLGFNFDEWPFRFLLDTLEVPKASLSITVNTEDTRIAVMNQDFYQDRFGIEFTQQEPLEFVKMLTDLYKQKAFRHEYGYISFVSEDKPFFQSFKEPLSASTFSKRIKFWDRTSIEGGDITEEVIKEKLDQATIYIPLISNKSIINESFIAEVNRMMERPEVLIFPIHTRDSLWEDVFPLLQSRTCLRLPGQDAVLQQASKDPSDADYKRMVELIKSKIR